MTAAATRDDLAAVVTALTEQAAVQRQWQAEYEAKAVTSRTAANDSVDHLHHLTHRSQQAMFERFAAQARGTAHGLEIGADMIRKYVSTP